MPNDGGFLSNISKEEAAEIRQNDPTAAKYLRRLVGARELVHNEERYALWLVGANPADLRTSPELSRRVAQQLFEISGKAASVKQRKSSLNAPQSLGKIGSLLQTS